MNGDLIAEKEYKETINGGVKTWQWLKNLFKKGKEEIDDEEFVKTLLEEAKGKAEEIDKIELESDFNAEMVETAEMVKDKEITNEKTKEMGNENEKSKELGNENIADPSKKIDEKPLENKQGIENANEKGSKDGKDLAQDSFVKDFGDTYTETLAQANPKAKKLGLGQEQENQNDGKSVWNYFAAKEEYMQYEKQQGKKVNKAQFMKEFKEYAEKKMTVDEMRVLIALSNSKNSKLTPEHKLLIKDCLDIAQKENKNFQFLSEGHKAIVRANSNQKIRHTKH